MDIALAITSIKPGAEYFGSVVGNTKEVWERVVWADTGLKPTWEEIEAAWLEIEKVGPTKEELMQELDLLDLKSIRPLRAILRGKPADEEYNYLNFLGEQASALRDRLNNMGY